jgi:hypothetical protein
MVSPPILASIAVTPPDPSIALGFTEQFTATGTFSDGSTANLTQTVTWGTAQGQVASIASGGLATSLKVGTTAVTAASGSLSGSTTLRITQPVLLSVAIAPAAPSVPLGSSEQLRAVGTYSDGHSSDLTFKATWSSTQPAVASISFGIVSGRELGTSTIQAVSGSISGSAILTVTAPVLSSIAITPANPNLAAGDTVQLTAAGTYTDGSTKDVTSSVVWSGSPNSVATVGSAGLVTAQGPGVAAISATLGPISGADAVVVSLASLAISPASPSLVVGAATQLSATGTFNNGSSSDVTTAVSWSSTVPTVAAVSSSGVAMAGKAGRTTVFASSASVTASVTLTVQPMMAVNYFNNANVAGLSSASVNLSNTGLTGAGLCAMFYVFAADEQMSECCGCQVSTDDLRTVLVNDDLTDNPLTGVEPTNGVIEIVPADMASNPSCDPSSIRPSGAVVAWSTQFQAETQSSFALTETDFRSVPFNSTQRAYLQTTCAAVRQLGSGSGVCRCGSGD